MSRKAYPVMFTEEEIARIRAAAEEAGLSVSAWLRTLALATTKKGKKS